MSKKMKIAYYALMAINLILCIVDIAIGRYFGAAITSLTALWLVICCRLVTMIERQDVMIDTCLKELADDLVKIREAEQREKIFQKTINDMRQRAEKAEKQLKELMDDTPARGKDGRFTKREV